MPMAIPAVAGVALTAGGATAGTTALVTGALSAGVSAYGQYSAGKTAAGVADQNAQTQVFNGLLQQGHARMSALQKFYASQSNAIEHSASARIGRHNARHLRRQARAEGDYSRENIRRQRILNDHFKGSQRAKFGVSGVAVNTGTPVEVLAETAAAMELEIQDMVQKSENRTRVLYDNAAMADWGARRDELAAKSERKLGKLGLDYDMYVAGLNMNFANNRADITRQVGAARQSAYNSQAMSSLYSGISKAYGAYDSYKDTGVF